MKKNEEVGVLQYGLASILTTNYEYHLPINKFDSGANDLINFNIDPKVSFKLDHSNIIVKINISAVVKETNENFMNISTSFAFKVPNLKDFVEIKDDGNYGFKDIKDNGLYVILISISYSGMRGIITERSRGTFLEHIYLPIVDPNVFIKPKTNT